MGRTLEVPRKYGLTIDRAEAAAAEEVLSGCDTTAIEVVACVPGSRLAPHVPAVRAGPTGNVDVLRLWDDNNNGRITCEEARRHSIAPVPRGHPTYRYMRDGDGVGVVCE